MLKGLNAKDANANSSTNSNPLSFNLSQNYPNPFNPRTIINYELRIRNFVVLKVYDIAGRDVATLVNDIMPAGEHAVEFNAADLSSGVYFYSLYVDGKQMAVKRMVLVK
ncbi:MAG: T9SS type A sorting domain-containing protein [Ignavibacteria bacterium]|nr:T9SS type A sorting domain-containing protein [Ignavibacteria bacterium]